MPRKLVRTALAAALVFGVVAMHFFGHSSHDGGPQGEIVVTAQHSQAQDAGTIPADDESNQFSLLSMMSLMVCGAILARFVFEFFRSDAWSRLWGRLLALAARPGPEPSHLWLPPPHLNPTGFQLNRIAVLRS